MKSRIFVVCVLISFIFTSFGCESFRRKFVRRKKRKEHKEEMVLYPKDYSKEQLPSDKAYRQYYTYWKAWHQELMRFLKPDESRKKIISCFEQTLLNLDRMKKRLDSEEKVNQLQAYIDDILSLESEVKDKNFQLISFSRLKDRAELLFRNIQRDFAFSKIEDVLKW